jgi:hypothetical protein
MPKTIVVTIPDNEIVPEILTSFSPEENYLMLKIGSDCLREGRNAVAGLTQKEIYAKIKEEASGDVHRLEMDIIVHKELTKQMEEKMSKMYEGQLTKMEKQIELLSNQLKEEQFGNQEIVEKEVKKEREKYDLLLQEKDRQNQLNREAFDKAEKIINKTNTKTSIAIGDDGEQLFENLADTFKDFPGYKIENKAKQGHKGDFHLFFEDFNILVDSKNYSGSVQKKEIKKIESDLMVNDNMNYAWLVSLNSNICEYNIFPIMTKWITTDVGVKCILFINNLLDHKEPRNILRQAWSICEDFYRLTKKDNKEDVSLVKYREKELLYKKHINNLQDRVSEMRRQINGCANVLKHMDNDLLEMLSLASDEIIEEKTGLNGKISEWWNMNIEYTGDENKLTSTEIWSRFKREHKDYVLENKVTIDQFKDVITTIAGSSTYTEKTKKSAIEFTGFQFKEIVIENLVIEKIEVPKKVKRNSKTEFYFNKELDEKILQEYENEMNDIMTISSYNNVKPWQIVSLLVRYKKITKRNESRGYDIYKESDEYKNNCIN